MRPSAMLSVVLLSLGTLAVQAGEEARLLRFPAIHGKTIVFTYAGDLYTVPADGGTARKLTNHDGFEMWVKCLEGDKKAWAQMKKYNIRDVKMLERLYYRFQPWISSHPNHSLFAKDTVCPYCGSKHIQSRGTYKTNVGEYRRMYCNDCGGWSRTRLTEIDLETRKKIVVGIQ